MTIDTTGVASELIALEMWGHDLTRTTPGLVLAIAIVMGLPAPAAADEGTDSRLDLGLFRDSGEAIDLSWDVAGLASGLSRSEGSSPANANASVGGAVGALVRADIGPLTLDARTFASMKGGGADADQRYDGQALIGPRIDLGRLDMVLAGGADGSDVSNDAFEFQSVGPAAKAGLRLAASDTRFEAGILGVLATGGCWRSGSLTCRNLGGAGEAGPYARLFMRQFWAEVSWRHVFGPGSGDRVDALTSMACFVPAYWQLCAGVSGYWGTAAPSGATSPAGAARPLGDAVSFDLLLGLGSMSVRRFSPSMSSN